MKFGDITKRLSEKQKASLREAKSNEAPGGLSASDKLELTDDQLGSIAGGAGAAVKVTKKVIK